MNIKARVISSVAAFTKRTAGDTQPPLVVSGARVYETAALLLGNEDVDGCLAVEIDLEAGANESIDLRGFEDPEGGAGVIQQLKVLQIHVMDGDGVLAITTSVPLFSDSNGVDMDHLAAGKRILIVDSAGIPIDEGSSTLLFQASGGSVKVRVVALGLQTGR